MHLVLGIDDSPCSNRALTFVRKMSWPPGTTATVVYSLPPFITVAPEAYMAVAEELGTLRMEQKAANEAEARKAADSLAAAGIAAKPSAPDGDPRSALLDTVNAEHADLLVVGSHGRSALGRMFMGSVANYVVNHAPCSVLVVRGSD